MPKKKHTSEEIISNLRQVDVLVAQSQSITTAVMANSVSEQCYYRWRNEYGGLRLDQAKRFKELEMENTRLRKAISDLAADADTALVEELTVTPGNVNDGRAGGAVPPNDPGEVYADSVYRGTPFASAVPTKGGFPRVAQTGVWGRHGSTALRKLRAWNHSVQHMRCRIEKIFGTWKRSYGLRRMRWLGLAKAALQVRLTAMAYNLKRTAVILRPGAA